MRSTENSTNMKAKGCTHFECPRKYDNDDRSVLGGVPTDLQKSVNFGADSGTLSILRLMGGAKLRPLRAPFPCTAGSAYRCGCVFASSRSTGYCCCIHRSTCSSRRKNVDVGGRQKS
ncbi:hypothetical protein NDU88_007993 [Pleurodeles waltl]|uniref:Uncharacterized protein n=1 Tax=Pleurodeles waltl TaxID=8319 RepID=A0AAV7QTE4_PLEWA|nr:hypothetical protein NDU88_007993 [Pleurodeles waltl]